MIRLAKIVYLAFFLVLGCCLFAVPSSADSVLAEAQPIIETQIVVGRIDGTINPATVEYVGSTLARAKEEGAQLVIFELNTPGGLLESMREIVESLLESEVPTAVYVSPSGASATSAGVFITMAANFAAMAPGTTIGAAHPVQASGDDITGDMRAKLENSTVSLGRAIAERRGRNAIWVERAVRESESITDREAVAEKVIDVSAASLEKLLAELEGKTAVVGNTERILRNLPDSARIKVEMSFRQRLINFVCDPNVAMLLMICALLGIGIEFFHPGLILPGLSGVICLILALTAGQVLPISVAGVALLLFGIVLLIAEIFIPAFGIIGIGGIVSIVLGAIYFVDMGSVWSSSGFQMSKGVIGGAVTVALASVFGLSRLAMTALRAKVATGTEALLGKEVLVVEEGRVTDSGTWKGRVRVMGELWRAEFPDCLKSSIPVNGDTLVVKEVKDGLLLIVGRNN